MPVEVARLMEGPHVDTEPLGASMRSRDSKMYTLEAVSEARTAALVSVAAVPTPSRKPAAPAPAAVDTWVGNQMAPGVVGGEADCVKEYVAPPRALENENPATEGETAFADVEVVTTK
jgi:hypothetical protein